MSYHPKSKLRNAEPIGNAWLTLRQRQVLELYATGSSRAEIVTKLGCGDKVIDHHIRAAKERLGATTLHHAVAIFAAANALKGRGGPSTRDSNLEGARVTVRATKCVEALTVPSCSELPQDRVL